MGILGTGIDIVEICRITGVIGRRPLFKNRVYTRDEIAYIDANAAGPQHAAGIFAAKEAVLKACGRGLKGVGWKDVEVLRDGLGKPYVVLHNRAKALAEERGIEKIHISISHEREYAIAQAIAEGCDTDEDCGCVDDQKNR